MRDPASLDGIGERLDHRILPDQLGKALRPVFARQHAVRRRRQRLRGFVEAEARRFVVVHLLGLGTVSRTVSQHLLKTQRPCINNGLRGEETPKQ